MTRHHHRRPDRPTRERSAASTLLTIYDGQTCRGLLLSRGKCGWEASDAEQRSLGLFASQRAAIDAVSEAAS
jgi:hypothetical protein